jgi:hypothetical protein
MRRQTLLDEAVDHLVEQGGLPDLASTEDELGAPVMACRGTLE